MSTSVKSLTTPVILLTGNQLLADGTKKAVVNLPWDQTTPYGSLVLTNANGTPNYGTSSPTSITTHTPIIFVGSVTVTMTSVYNLKSYSSDPVDNSGNLNGPSNVDGLSTGTQATGSIIYYFNNPGKRVSPTEAKVYTGAFQIVKPGKSFSGKGYVFADDVITLQASVAINGEVSKTALAFIKIV